MVPRIPLRTARKSEAQSGTSCQPVPGANGNSEHSPHACYKYDVTINNYSDLEVYTFCASVRDICKKAIVAKEVGEEGTPHLQCYISLKVKQRIKDLHRQAGFERASMRACRNEPALIDYCRKTGGVILDFGIPKPPKVPRIITELREWQAEIEKIYFGTPDPRKIHWFWESEGNIGKSEFVKYMVVKHKALFCDGGKKADIINLVFNNNMDDCKCIIWDLPRVTEGNISYSSLESIKNGLVCNTKYETGTKVFDSPHVFVFANFVPSDMSKLSKDRWDIREIIINT